MTSAPQRRKQSPAEIRSHARAFRIYREGASVDWDCSFRELADATGMSISTVIGVCRKHGYVPIKSQNNCGIVHDEDAVGRMTGRLEIDAGIMSKCENHRGRM